MEGYLYILSNPSIKNDLLKIGLTKMLPEDRCKSLSKSTAIPADFVIEHSVKVPNVSSAEARLHLVLSEYRYKENKEFFSIPLKKALQYSDLVTNYIENHEGFSPTYSLHNDLIHSNFDHNLSLYEMKIMRLIITATIGNTIIDRMFSEESAEIDGFLSSIDVAKFLNISKRSANIILSKLQKKSAGRSVSFFAQKDSVIVFDSIDYYRGELCWKWSRSFKLLFLNEKI